MIDPKAMLKTHTSLEIYPCSDSYHLTHPVESDTILDVCHVNLAVVTHVYVTVHVVDQFSKTIT